MRKTILVAKNELLQTLRNKGIMFVSFGLPLIVWVVFLGAQFVQEKSADASKTSAGLAAERSHGIVDRSGIIKDFPASVPKDSFTFYENESSARRAFKRGDISGYFLIPRDYLDSRKLVSIRNEVRIPTDFTEGLIIDQVLIYNLLGSDPGLLAATINPAVFKEVARGSSGEATATRDEHYHTYLFQLMVLTLFFVLIAGSAGQLLKSIGLEKRNRTIEVMLTSTTPGQLLTGKTVGLGIFGLMQTTVWIGTGYALTRISGKDLPIPKGFSISPGTLVWGLAFFVFGYALYASLLAGAGAMISDMREVSQASWAAMAPLILGFLVMEFSMDNMNAALPTGLSIFPLTSPIAMVARLSGGNVTLWQPVVSLILLALATVLVNRTAAKMFRAQYLLSGQKFSVGGFYRALFGRFV